MSEPTRAMSSRQLFGWLSGTNRQRVNLGPGLGYMLVVAAEPNVSCVVSIVRFIVVIIVVVVRLVVAAIVPAEVTELTDM